MSLEIFSDIEQLSEQWYAVRRGIPTASEFDSVQAKGVKGGPSKTRTTYMYKLAGERLTELPMESYSNGYMERGRQMEDEARKWYEMVEGVDVERVGFVRCPDRRAGASPDGFVGEEGGVEIKTKAPHLQIAVLEAGKLPPEHVAQVQGTLWITGRKWIDFISYFTRMPPFKIRVYRDEAYIAALAVAVQEFNTELDALVRKYS